MTPSFPTRRSSGFDDGPRPFETSSGDTAIRPPMTRRPMAPMPPKNGPRYNEFIASPKVRVIDGEGENLGVMLTAEAIEAAAEVGLDLVEEIGRASCRERVCQYV